MNEGSENNAGKGEQTPNTTNGNIGASETQTGGYKHDLEEEANKKVIEETQKERDLEQITPNEEAIPSKPESTPEKEAGK